MEIDELRNKIKTLYDTINNFKDSLTLKEDQLSTMQSTLNLKDDQIKTLQNSLNLKEEKITTLEKTIKLKEDELISLKENSTDKAILKDKEKEIEDLKKVINDFNKENNDLKKETGILQDELTKADEEFDHLEQENEKLRKDLVSSSDLKIMDFTNANITKDEIIEKMREILQKSLHSATITVPDISDLQKLHMYEVRSSVNIKISCSIDPEIEGNTDLLEEYESLDNISLRNFEGSDRYIINRDGEELMIAIIGKEENNHLAIYTKDPAHITLFNSIVMEGWLRSRKI